MDAVYARLIAGGQKKAQDGKKGKESEKATPVSSPAATKVIVPAKASAPASPAAAPAPVLSAPSPTAHDPSSVASSPTPAAAEVAAVTPTPEAF